LPNFKFFFHLFPPTINLSLLLKFYYNFRQNNEISFVNIKMVIIMTKSFFITMLVAILIGAVLGNFLFEQYKLESESVIKEVNSTYFLMEGSYSTKEQAKKTVTNIEPYLIVKEDSNYIVYLAITSSNDNLEKLKKMYKEKGINASIKKMSIENEEFLANLEQMDILLNKAKTNDEVNSINEVVLANYQEFVLE